MPSLITHDAFGHDVYERLGALIGTSRDEEDAFLLGSQGPDALFFAHLNPVLRSAFGVGSELHRTDPNRLLAGFRAAAARRPTEAGRRIARAYVMGLACHYLLDSAEHPLVYAQERALCDAGVEGLDRSDAHEVHAAIETELDEAVLWSRHGQTIATFNPAKRILRCGDDALAEVSALYAEAVWDVLGRAIAPGAFASSVRQWRAVQALLHTPTGVKRAGLGALEQLVRRHSMLQALSHRDRPSGESGFDNRQHAPWVDPFTGDVRHVGFWDLYDEAYEKALRLVPLLDAPGFSAADAEPFTGGRSFLGDLAAPVIVEVEPIEGAR